VTEELVRRGHDVTLFASGDSETKARLVAVTGTACGLRESNRDAFAAASARQLGMVFERAAEFDVIHCHVDFPAFPFTRLVTTPTVHTIHGRLDLPYLRPLYRQFAGVPLVSISRAQRAPLASLPLGWVGTVHHGVSLAHYTYGAGPGRYLAFLGRIAPEKRPDLAIETARRTGLPLRIAAKVDPVDRVYYETEIVPRLVEPGIEFVGEIGEADKPAFLGNALALLFPIDWPEPFGLVTIEAMACGTPVVARPCGSAPEIVADGRTGVLASTLDELVEAVQRIHTLDRAECRRHVERHFSVARMVDGYEAVYRRMLLRARAA
jgi:glycosyltransferase involved in cell wall biosynthesis